MNNREFDYAYGVLTGQVDNNLLTDYNNNPTRDVIFDGILQQLKPNPINVFQVGAIETFRADWRLGSGWSDIIFGKYIKEYGGKLTIADINLDHLANSSLASSSLDYDINIIYGNAVDHIGDMGYNHIYYLDGSNDPKETLDQLNSIAHKNCIVIVDDFSIKGTLLPEEFVNEGYVHNVANGVGVFRLGEADD